RHLGTLARQRNKLSAQLARGNVDRKSRQRIVSAIQAVRVSGIARVAIYSGGIRNVCIRNGASAARDCTTLHRTVRRVVDRDEIFRTRSDRRGEFETAVRADRYLFQPVTQLQSNAGQAGDGA